MAYEFNDPKMVEAGIGEGETIAGDPLALETALVEAERYGKTKRGLKSRHVQLIALGGAIGTGLFVGSGRSYAPGGVTAPLEGWEKLMLCAQVRRCRWPARRPFSWPTAS